MLPLRLFLFLMLVAILAYTGAVISHHGIDFLPVFFGDMAAMAWPGQFNLDFMTMLALSAIWVAWRHQYSAGGLALAVLAFFGGMLFLSIYLLVHSRRTGGNVPALLLGEARAAGA